MNTKNKNATIKNLITIGIFNALLLVAFWIIACTIGFFPPILLVLPIILGLVGGTIFMLMIAKAPMKGAFIISGALMGSTLITMAPKAIMFWGILAGGFVGELLFNLIGRNKFIAAVSGFASIMLGYALGEYIPFVYMQDTYIALYKTKTTGTLPIVQQCLEIMNPNLMIILCIITVTASILGCLWGKKLLHKHFKKAGIV